MKSIYLWSIPIALLFPVAQIVLFYARFGRWPTEGYADLFSFFTVGLLGALFFLYLLTKSSSRPQQIGTIAGFVLLSPIGLIGSLGGGIVLGPFVGTVVFGTIPLILGTAAGFGVGTGVQKVFYERKR
jgi:hypothetical protein